MRFVAANGDDDPLADDQAPMPSGPTRRRREQWRRVRAASIAGAGRRARRRDRHDGESAIRQADEDHDRERRHPDEHDRLRRLRLDGDAARACRVHRRPRLRMGCTKIVERKLREHGILVEKTRGASRMSVEQFVIAEVRHAEQAVPGSPRHVGDRPVRAARGRCAGGIARRAHESAARAAGVLSAGAGERRRPDDVELSRCGAEVGRDASDPENHAVGRVLL